jgi:acetoin utilization deacetylase AcuC-like enzyme
VTIFSDDRCTLYHAPGHPERPARISASKDLLAGQFDFPILWKRPSVAPDAALLRAHSPEHIARLSIPHDFDADTAYHAGIDAHARRSAGAALDALAACRAGELVFSLMRPPGHHATRETAMGFCYLSNAAIAALEARASGVERVAVFDFDVHHGNGTEDILLNQPGTAFFSVHQHPCYPGTGQSDVGDNCFNFPVPPHLRRTEYVAVLKSALNAMRSFDPQVIVASAGFDAYAHDPLAQGTLQAEDFFNLGASLRAFGVPVCNLLEGGYSDDLPNLIFEYLKGLHEK